MEAEERMQVRHVALALCLLSVSAWNQSPTQASTSLQTPIQGIKILSSSFDTKTQTATLEFMNESHSDITAWGYCLKDENVKGDSVEHGGCRGVETLGPVIDREVQEKITGKPSVGDCSDCHFLRPGEHKTLTVDFSSVPVVSSEIVIDLIVYEGGKVESIGHEGAGLQQHFAKSRREALDLAQKLIEMGEEILSDESNQHPTATMIQELESRIPAEPEMAWILRNFKRPDWRHLKDTEYIPKDERGYLQQFVTEQRMKADELSKHQIAAVNQ